MEKKEKEAPICPGSQEFDKKSLLRWPRFEDLQNSKFTVVNLTC